MGEVRLSGVRKSFGPVSVIEGIDLDIAEGEFVAFVGPSGSGKSTLLRMIAGLETVSAGDILIGGQNVTFAEPGDRGIAMVFQSYALYPHMNVFENIAFNLRLSRLPRPEVEARVRDAARILRLDALLDRSPAQLSGGQRQRVAIGRAIVRKPRVFLFDEPLSNLDAALRVQMRLEIERLHRELGTTMIYVTHDQVEAMTLADRIVALDQGRVQQVGPPLEMYAHPANRFVAGFIGSPTMNFLPARVAAVTDGQARLEATGMTPFHRPLAGARAGDSVTLGIRPEALRLGPADAAGDDGPALQARVETVERLGNITFVYLDPGAGDLLTLQIMGDLALANGDTVRAIADADSIHVFDDKGRSMTAAPT
ncbi:MAG: sn-glycerol-3-phosphate ABC transporter ATP-binding protein UgpC [Rubellimicrobium sp.]|nr:sn-glycerol-3-phosphate ABC transporter ATP-binding protein UgpC [Rubellimicrobium sp.]